MNTAGSAYRSAVMPAVGQFDSALELHMERMGAAYRDRFGPEAMRRHLAMFEELSERRLCRVVAERVPDGGTLVTVAAYDFVGELAIICGLLSAAGLSINAGAAFTASDPPAPPSTGEKPSRTGPAWWRRRSSSPAAAPALPKRKIIDVFEVRPLSAESEPDAADLENRLDALLRHLAAGDWRAAREALIEPVCETLRRFVPGSAAALLPVHVELDNETLPDETLVRIESTDTPAFLFQLLVALAMRGIYVRRMEIDTRDGQVRDTLAVTDVQFRKLDIARRSGELRASVALVKQFTHLLPRAPNPPMALRNFGQFLDDQLSRPDWASELTDLRRPAALTALAQLMGVSEFLWEDFLRLQYENLLPMLTDAERLAPRMSVAEMRDQLAGRLAAVPAELPRQAEALNAWKDEQMFRIDMRHILRREEFVDFSAEMSDMAETAVSVLFDLVRADLIARHGRPRLPDGRPCRFCLAALGKTGGREMGVASDIELMLLFDGEGVSDGPEPIANSQYAAWLVRGLNNHLHPRREGIFELDWRLKPHGESGPPAVTPSAFADYYGPGGQAPNLQRQALVRLRPVAGDPDFGREVVRLRDRVLYEGGPLDVANLLHLRRRQIEQFVPAGRINAKYSPGGLVDIEYTVQALQVRYGRREPALRSPSTLTALGALESQGRLESATAAALREAYLFLRRLIDALRIVRGHAKDLCLPEPSAPEFAYLARRMGYPAYRQEITAGQLADDLRRSMDRVRGLTEEILRREFPEAVASAAG